MKKILSVLLASLLLLSTSATAFAMETETNADNWLVSANQHQIIHNAKIAAETGQNVTLTTKILSDLSDNHFELVEVGDTGYMIFDPQSGKYLEEALDSPSPYLGLSENLYYFGPLNYYQLSGDKFVHTVIHNEYDMSFAECRSLQSAFDTALQNSRTQKDTEVLALMQTNLNSRASVNRLQSHFSARATNKYIPNYKYIKNAIYPANENNTCGYTAACLILNYWHKVKGNVIDSSFLDSNGNLKTTIGNSLAQKTRGAAVIIGCRARVIFYSASESVMVNCASSNAASVMFCSLWIVCSASGRIAASISGSASEIAAIVLRQSCLW